MANGLANISLLAVLGVIGMARAVGAATIPNPGGPVVTTNSTTATISDVDTPVTQRVGDYSTTLVALVNGDTVFSQTYSLPFSDPSVQAAVTEADSILSGEGVTSGTPALVAGESVLQSSVTTPPPTYTCLSAPPSALTGGSTDTVVITFGPNTISVGQCKMDTFVVLSGQEDINVNTDVDYAIPRTIVTTDTYLTTQTYDIVGTTTQVPTPEPASAVLVFAGLGAMIWRLTR